MTKRKRRHSAKKRLETEHAERGVSGRIGIDITAAVTQGGGIGRYTRELVQALTSAVPKDSSYQYHLFSARKPAQMPTADPIPRGERVQYREAGLSSRWLYRLWYRMRVPLRVQWYTGPIDLFHSPDFVLPPVAGGIPTLLTVHDLSFVHYPETFTPELLRFLNGTVPRSIERATHVLADSEATRTDLLSVWNVSSDKVTVLNGGVHPRFHPITKEKQLAAVRRKYGLDGAPYLLSVGTLQPRKNYQMLIQAFKAVAEQWPHVLAIAGGRGWLYEETLSEVERQGLTGRVRFLDFVDDEDLPALYSGAALFLFPSLYEGFGLPPLEAMACGAPVLVSNASCLPEVVGEAAIQLAPNDQRAWREAMHLLLLDDARRSRMVAAGFLQARKFTWKRAANELRDIYHELLTGQI